MVPEIVPGRRARGLKSGVLMQSSCFIASDRSGRLYSADPHAFPQQKHRFRTIPGKTCQAVNDLYACTYAGRLRLGKMPLTSPPAGPTLQSQTGFVGCDAVESGSPIKRNPWTSRGLVAGKKMLIRENEHFLLKNYVFPPRAANDFNV